VIEGVLALEGIELVVLAFGGHDREVAPRHLAIDVATRRR
jgi:hypothetical protein